MINGLHAPQNPERTKGHWMFWFHKLRRSRLLGNQYIQNQDMFIQIFMLQHPLLVLQYMYTKYLLVNQK